MKKILRVNMTDRSYKFEDVPEAYRTLGGRGLTSTIVYDEVTPTVNPLGPYNKLVFAPGIVTGTAASTSGRISAGAKSPLTGGIKESNAGSQFPQDLARMGLHAIIVEGYPQDDKYWIMYVKWDKAAGMPKIDFLPADAYVGRGLYDVFPELFEQFGEKVSIAGTGMAGERRYLNSGIVYNDIDGRPSRYSGRGGLGAVMASKGLKFIVTDRAGSPAVPLADKAIFEEGRKKLVDALRSHPITKPGGGLNTLGTAVLVNIINEAGGFPTRNFREGQFEGAANISGEMMAQYVKERGGGRMGHPCHPGCIIQCSNIIPKEDGSELVSVIEYETTWAFGANCGIDSLDVIGELTRMTNDFGMDTIEMGGTIAVAMEAGLAKFGDGKRAIELMEEVGKGTPLGRLLGNGATLAGKALGVIRVPSVKGQNMPAYEPRAIKGIGVTYATSPMGADHTAGYTIAPENLSSGGQSDPLSVEGKADLSRAFQEATAFIDSTGHCLFIAFAILDIPSGFEGVMQECNGVLGTNWTTDDATKYGIEVLKKERAFNFGAGLSEKDDRLPEFMSYEKLPPHNVTFDIPDEELDSVFGKM